MMMMMMMMMMIQSVAIAKNHLAASVQTLHIDVTMETAIFSEAVVVPTSKTPRHHIPAARIPSVSLQLLVSSNIRSLPRK